MKQRILLLLAALCSFAARAPADELLKLSNSSGTFTLQGTPSGTSTLTLPAVTGTALTTAAPITVGQGGTGQTSYTNGQLLIGNTSGNTLAKGTLTAGSGITITNGAGSITISATGSLPEGTVDGQTLMFEDGSPVWTNNINALNRTLSGGSWTISGLNIAASGAIANPALLGTPAEAATGTVAVSASATAVVGTGTAFTSEFEPGDPIEIAGEVIAVAAVADDTHLTLDAPHTAGAAAVVPAKQGDMWALKNAFDTTVANVNKDGKLFHYGSAAFTGNTAFVDFDGDFMQIRFTPLDGAVEISPDGSGTVTINPNSGGTMNGMVIGNTAPAAGTFTTLASGNQTVTGTIAASSTISTAGYVLAPYISFGSATTTMTNVANGWGTIRSSDLSGGGWELLQRTSLGTPSTDSVRIGAKDVGGTAEVFVKDEAGNETQISAHASDAPEALYDARDFGPDQVLAEAQDFTGRRRWTNHTREAALVEMLIAVADDLISELPANKRNKPAFQALLALSKAQRKIVHEETYDESNTRLGLTGERSFVRQDWQAVQTSHVAKRNEERTSWATRKAEHDAKRATDPALPAFAEPEPPAPAGKNPPKFLQIRSAPKAPK